MEFINILSVQSLLRHQPRQTIHFCFQIEKEACRLQLSNGTEVKKTQAISTNRFPIVELARLFFYARLNPRLALKVHAPNFNYSQLSQKHRRVPSNGNILASH